ncbi:hypothetical protein RJZ56_004769 [Blastomyces dermatitidis]
MSLLSKRLFRACCCEVLVPELLEMLVREDMGVDARGARRILKESNKIGKLLNLEQIEYGCDPGEDAEEFRLTFAPAAKPILPQWRNLSPLLPVSSPWQGLLLPQITVSGDRELLQYQTSGGRGLWGMNREFEDVINTFVTHPAGSRASFRDWAKLTSMGEGIGRFRLMLAGYQYTMNIALGDATLYASLRCIFPIKLTIWLIAAEQYAN